MKKGKNKLSKAEKKQEKKFKKHKNQPKKVSQTLLGFVLGALTVLIINALIIGFLIGKNFGNPKEKPKK